MRTLSAFLAAGLLALPVFAQQNYMTIPPVSAMKSGATMPWSEQGYQAVPAMIRTSAHPTPGAVAAPQDETTLDTLSQYLDRATDGQITVYGYNDGTSNWPVTGTNTIYVFLGAKYEVSSPISVKGILVAYALKQISGEADTLVATLFSVDAGTGLPNQQIRGTVFTTDMIDTSSTGSALTYIEFPEPVSVESDFVALIQTVGSSQTDPSDFTAVFSNQQGDGQGEDNAVFLAIQNQQLVAAHLSQIPLEIDGSAINVDPIIMPVVEITTTDVRETATLNGLSLRGAYPSPASDKSTIRFAIDKPSFVEISLLDMTGKAVMSVRRDNMSAGEQAVDLNISELPAGSYLYTVRTASSALAGKMSVVK